MAEVSKMRYGLGCTKSALDGTEHIATWEKADIPDSFSWEWAMPAVRDQGSTSTCVCQTLISNLDFYYNGITGQANKCNSFSINELYDQRLDKKADGMQIKTALKYLKHHGLKAKDGEQVTIDNYAMVTNTLSARYAILMNGPLAIGLPVYDNNSNYFWKKSGNLCGGHCVGIVGYTPTSFIIRNSWGTSWGDRGYIEITDRDFTSSCFEAWTFTL